MPRRRNDVFCFVVFVFVSQYPMPAYSTSFTGTPAAHWTLYSGLSLSWNQASYFCKSLGGHLPVFNTKLKMSAFNSTATLWQSAKTLTQDVWSGLYIPSSAASPTTWEASCSEHPTELNFWDVNEPDFTSVDLCVSYTLLSKRLRTTNCASSQGTVCEFDKGRCGYFTASGSLVTTLLQPSAVDAADADSCWEQCIDYPPTSSGDECVAAEFDGLLTRCTVRFGENLLSTLQTTASLSVSTTSMARECFDDDTSSCYTSYEYVDSSYQPRPAGSPCTNGSFTAVVPIPTNPACLQTSSARSTQQQTVVHNTALAATRQVTTESKTQTTSRTSTEQSSTETKTATWRSPTETPSAESTTESKTQTTSRTSTEQSSTETKTETWRSPTWPASIKEPSTDYKTETTWRLPTVTPSSESKTETTWRASREQPSINSNTETTWRVSAEQPSTGSKTKTALLTITTEPSTEPKTTWQTTNKVSTGGDSSPDVSPNLPVSTAECITNVSLSTQGSTTVSADSSVVPTISQDAETPSLVTSSFLTNITANDTSTLHPTTPAHNDTINSPSTSGTLLARGELYLSAVSRNMTSKYRRSRSSEWGSPSVLMSTGSSVFLAFTVTVVVLFLASDLQRLIPFLINTRSQSDKTSSGLQTQSGP